MSHRAGSGTVCYDTRLVLPLQVSKHTATSSLRNTIPVCRGASTGLTMRSWLFENFCDSAITGVWFSTQNTPKAVCRPGSAQTNCGSSQRPPKPSSWIWEGTRGREGNKGKEGEEREREREREKERQEGSIPALLFSLPALVLHGWYEWRTRLDLRVAWTFYESR